MTEQTSHLDHASTPARPNDVDVRTVFLSVLPGMVAILLGMGFAVIADSLFLRGLGLLVAALPMLLMDVRTLKLTLLAVMLLEIAFPIDVHLSHQSGLGFLDAKSPLSPERANVVAGFNVSVVTLCLVVLYALWLAETLGNRTSKSPSIWRPTIPAVVYTATMLISVLVAREATLAMFEVVLTVQALLLLIYMVHAVRTQKHLLFVVTWLVIALTAQASLAVAQAAFGLSIELGPLNASASGGRVAGALGSPNILASYLILLIPVALGLAATRVSRALRILGAGAAGTGTLALVLTGSRGGWLGFGAAVVLLGFLAHRVGWLSVSTLTAVAAGAVVLSVVLFGNFMLERFSSGSTVEGRVDLMEIAVGMISDQPVLGVGANNFAAAIDPYVTVDYSRSWISTVHNKYLLVWAETGIFGLAFFSWMLISGLRLSWKAARPGNLTISPLAAGLLAGIAANMVQMSFSIFHTRSQLQLLFLAIGLIIAISKILDTESEHVFAPSVA